MSTLIDVNPDAQTVSSPHQPPPADETTAAQPSRIITIEEIQKLLPHRYPFLLVDRIIDYVPGKSAVGIKNVTVNEPHFQGHFPHRPIMPGVLIIEAMAQVGGIVFSNLPDVDE